MKIHILQHVDFEGPATITAWAKSKSHDVSTTQFFEPSWTLPDVKTFDCLIILGGPMSIYDEVKYHWLIEEKRFIRDFIDTGRPVLGICLGAQLLADALGARVYPNPQKEMGWFPVYKTNIPHPILFDMPSGQMAFHWHSDTFEMPQGALHLATSDACNNQAFIWNNQVMGFQFHLEMAPEHIEMVLANHFQDAKGDNPFVQSDAVIREGFGHTEIIGPLFDNILTRFSS